MKSFTRMLTLVLCVLLLAACGNSGGKGVSTKHMSKLVLAAGDLPSGFSAFANGPTVGLDTRGTSRSDPARFGREGGWVIRLHRSGSAATRGPLVVASTVDVFKDSTGAKRDLSRFGSQFGQIAGLEAIKAPKLGDAAVAGTGVQAGALSVRTYIIGWRERNATATLTVNGFDGKLALKDVVRLARRQERRLARA
jgi:hypothetical protein